MGVFYVFCSWGVLVGFGTDHAADLATQTQNPLLVVSDRLVVGAEWIALLAIINSALACAIATTSASTRVFFAMGRAGVAPRALGTLNARRTPLRAIQVQTVITLAYGLIVGLWIGPDQEFYVTGIFITLGLIFIYGAGNVGVIRYYLRERRSEFSVLLHGVLPVVSTVALVWVGYKSVVPLPTGPVRWAPFIFAVWAVAGVILVWFMSRTGREPWLLRAGEIMHEAAPDEIEAK
jgi:amino acid transporter